MAVKDRAAPAPCAVWRRDPGAADPGEALRPRTPGVSWLSASMDMYRGKEENRPQSPVASWALSKGTLGSPHLPLRMSLLFPGSALA